MKVVFATAARTDLRQIGDHIAKDNPERSRSFMRELRGKATELGQWPQRFPLVDATRSVRKRTHGAYLIFYRIEETQVTVIRFIAMDYEALPIWDQ